MDDNYVNNTENNIYVNEMNLKNIGGLDYTPISPFGYMGYVFLFSIPVVGIVLMLVFALGGTNNVNLKNLSLAFLIYKAIVYAICIVFFMFMFLIVILGFASY